LLHSHHRGRFFFQTRSAADVWFQMDPKANQYLYCPKIWILLRYRVASVMHSLMTFSMGKRMDARS
jgi:hypothetical protein